MRHLFVRVLLSPALNPILATVVLLGLVGHLLAARLVYEFQHTTAGGLRLDLPATGTCSSCGKLSVLTEHNDYRCPFCNNIDTKSSP